MKRRVLAGAAVRAHYQMPYGKGYPRGDLLALA